MDSTSVSTAVESHDVEIGSIDHPIAGNDNANDGRTEEESLPPYDAATIRAEFQRYKHVLPSADQLLQQQPSGQWIRQLILEQQPTNDSRCSIVPRFLRNNKTADGISPHHALCCLLLSDYQAVQQQQGQKQANTLSLSLISSALLTLFSLGCWHWQLDHPAEFIRDQFYRVAHAIPTAQKVSPEQLRHAIRHQGLPVPNYFLDPEQTKQFPPHIALLVILLQDNDNESHHFFYRLGFGLFAFVALFLRIVLEVIGGAGAIWGGAEVVALRTAESAELWRWISVAVGVLCFLRFLTLNSPQTEDEGDILGPAGPWSLRLPLRLRAVCNHPFHYFVRALPPFAPTGRKKNI